MNTRASLVFALNMQGVGLTMDKTAPFQCTQQRVQILGAGQESAALGTWRGSPTRLSDVVWDWKDGCLVQLRPVSVIFRHVKDPGQICIDGCFFFFCFFFHDKKIRHGTLLTCSKRSTVGLLMFCITSFSCFCKYYRSWRLGPEDWNKISPTLLLWSI